MGKKDEKKTGTIPPDVLEAIDEAAADLAAETSLTKTQAREAIVARMQAKADASVADVDAAADKVEQDEKDGDDEKDEKDEKAEKDEDDEKDEEKDEEDEKPERKPDSSHWSEKPLFSRKGGSNE